MTDLDLTELREIAEAAMTTPGPWSEYLLAFDPPTVIALIDELEQLRRWKREAKQVLKGLDSLAKVADASLGHPIIESAIDEIERLRGVVEQVRALA